jgi:transposase
MSSKTGVRRPTAREMQQLRKGLIKITDLHQRRRAEALTLYGMKLSPAEIAQAQGVHLNTIYKDLCAFAELGVQAIEQLQPSGAPRRITREQVEQIAKIAEQSPQEAGLPYGRWTLRKLCAYLIKQRIVKTIGRERLRQLLKKRVFAFGECNANSSARIRNDRQFWHVYAGFSNICPPVGI